MKIILIGCLGKMGKLVIDSLSKQDEIVAYVDVALNEKCGYKIYKTINDVAKTNADVIIDFSTMKERCDVIYFAKQHHIPYACFSTNVSESDCSLMREAGKNVPVLKCSNASVGVNAMFEMLKSVSNRFINADVVLTEYHHKCKLDAPSGTAKEILNIMKNNKIQLSCFRVADEVGTHKIEIFLEGEKLEITHKANSKSIFAIGALNACRKLMNKSNGFFQDLSNL